MILDRCKREYKNAELKGKSYVVCENREREVTEGREKERMMVVVFEDVTCSSVQVEAELFTRFHV